MSVVLALGSVLLAACSEKGDDLAPGDVVMARHEDQFDDARKASVTIPTGRLLIHAGEPVSRLDGEDTRELTDVKAPSGMSFVPVTWQYDSWSSGTFDTYADTTDVPIVDLVADGEKYRLASPDRDLEEGQSFYVLVDGEAEDRSLEVAFDGVTQAVDLVTGERDPGRAAGLYDVDETELQPRPCDVKDWFRRRNALVQFSCDIRGPVLLPYAGGEWAEPGHQWLAVSLETLMQGYAIVSKPGSGAHYGAARVRTEVRLDGARPDHQISPKTGDNLCPNLDAGTCNYSRQLIFDVPDGEVPQDLVVTQTYRLVVVGRYGNYQADERLTVVGSNTIPLPEPEG